MESKYWFSRTVFMHNAVNRATAQTTPSQVLTIVPGDSFAAAALSTNFSTRAITMEGRNWTKVLKNLMIPERKNSFLYLMHDEDSRQQQTTDNRDNRQQTTDNRQQTQPIKNTFHGHTK
jgi:hypothetical protein